jgi:glycosyltransferase involved in cell wall biosynthesis
MRILCLTGWFPYPPDNGARIRLYHLLHELGTEHELDLLCFVRPGEDKLNTEVLKPACRLVGAVSFRSSTSSGLRALLRLLSSRPRAALDSFNPAMADLLKQALQLNTYDLILAFEIGPGVCTSHYVSAIGSVPKVVEDLELSMIQAKAQARHTPLGRWRHQLTWWKQRQYAARLLRQVDGCTVVSRQEQQLIWDIVPEYRQLEVVPNGVDTARYAGDFGPVEPWTLVYPGALTYEANLDAMRFFLYDVFPRIKAAQPTIKLRITGHTDGVDLHSLPLTPDVILTGYLEDVRPTVARSAICIAPLREGGGTRIKILEAMALGTPVVSTSKGAEGLEVTPGVDITIADSPADFADAVLFLLANGALRAKLARNGRRLVVERYGWDRIGKRLSRFLCSVVETHQAERA